MAVDQQTIDRAAQMLLDAAPGSRVILFGSHARGRGDSASDVDFLVVEPYVKSRIQEMVRLHEVLRPLLVPVDVLVVSQEQFEYWKDTPTTVYYDAAREGKVYEQVA
ncbi:MAG TPA: nucleotidyltransferase domain-containing protein [Phycisphaerae bacterium]|nr:nucleotidyltransferase domain-containing protein [Phycisphaerae bacterium]